MIKISKAQVLHLLSGAVLVPVATVVSGWLTSHFPGLPHFTPQQIADEEYVIAAGGYTLALHYLHGLQLWERHVTPVAAVAGAVEPAVVPAPVPMATMLPGTIPPVV